MTSRLSAVAVLGLALAVAGVGGGAVRAQPQPTTPAVDPLSQIAVAVLPAPPAAKPLAVTSPAFAPGGDIPLENTRYRANIFPGLAWSAGPKGVRTYAVVMQDPDTIYQGAPLVHWTLFDVPAGTTRLPAAMTDAPQDAQYGPNFHGLNQPYRGPHTPPGPKHHYYFQVFALDAALPKAADVDYPTLIAEMKGHVLASGQLIGLGFADPDAKPAS